MLVNEHKLRKTNNNADFPGIECSGTDSIHLNSGCKCCGRTGGTGDDEGGKELHDRYKSEISVCSSRLPD